MKRLEPQRHRDTETQRRPRQRQEEGEEGEEEGKRAATALPSASVALCICLLCVSVSLWFKSLLCSSQFRRRGEGAQEALDDARVGRAAQGAAEEGTGLFLATIKPQVIG